MKKLSLFTFVFVLLFFFAAGVFAQWQKFSNGIYGGDVRALYSDNNMILVGTANGIQRSTDNGLTWRNTDMQFNKATECIIMVGSNLYAGTVNLGVFKSTNNGVNWSQTPLNNLTVNELANIGTDLFAATAAGVYYSSNSGINWSLRSLGTFNIKGIINHQNVLFVNYINQIFRSTDLGLSWTFCAGALTNVMCSANGNLYLGCDMNNGIWYSSNMGTNWTQCLTGESVWALFANGLYMYCGSYNGVKTSINGGFSWNNTALTNQTIVSLSVNSSKIFAGTQTKGIFFSSNAGANWGRTLDEENINTLLTVDSTIFCGTLTSGIYSTTNNGANWNEVLPGVNVYAMLYANNNIFAGINTGLIKSANWGANWSSTSLADFVFSIYYVNNLLFAGTQSNGIYRSSNMGTNWTQLSINNKQVKAIKSNGSYIFAAAFDNTINADDGVYISINNGNSWSIGGLNNEKVNDLLIFNGNLYAGTDLNGLYVSTNNGANWSNTSLTNKTVLSLFSQSNVIFASTSDSGLYVSTNNGNTWLLRNEGMGYQIVLSMTYKNNYLFAGNAITNVWRRPFNELITIINAGSSIVSDNYHISQNYPNPFNPVTNIKFNIPNLGLVRISVFDISGREVDVLVNEILPPGSYQTDWKAFNYSSGVYFYKITAGDFTETRKMVLIK